MAISRYKSLYTHLDIPLYPNSHAELSKGKGKECWWGAHLPYLGLEPAGW